MAQNKDFDLNDFVDAATGEPAVEVVGKGGPGHYYLEHAAPPPVGVLAEDAEVMVSDEKPSAADMLRGLMTQKHDSTRLATTIPVKELMAVLVEIGNIQRKAQANGQLCMEKTRELVTLRAQLSAAEEALEAKNVIITRVWTLLENESPFGEDLRAEDVRAALSTRPEANAKSVLGETVEPVGDVPATEEPPAE